MSRRLRPLRLLLAMMLVACGLVVAPTSTAAACACGGLAADPGSAAKVYDEAAVILFDGRTERIDMTLRLTSSDATSAAWLMPAPAGTKLSLGDKGVLARLDAAAAPEVVTRRKVRLTTGFGEAANSPGESGATVTVESQVRIGPFDVTTLSGLDASAVNTWLGAHGFGARDNLLPIFQNYLDQGLWIYAVKLVPQEAATLGRALPPLRLSFATEHAVYPMKLSSAATVDQRVRIHILAVNRMDVSNQAAPSQPLGLDFAGEIPSSVASLDSGLASRNTVWLTSWSGTLTPSRITGDYRFSVADSNTGYQRQITRYEYVDIPVLVIMFLVVPVGLLTALVLVLAHFWRKSRRR